MTPILVFVHGWGFGADFWDPLRRELRDLETRCIDLGFTGSEARAKAPRGRPVIAVGHSLGGAWLLHEQPFPWSGLVLVNGFSRFVADDGFPGLPVRTLDLMRKQFQRDPDKVTREFLERCGGDAFPAMLDNGRLAQGLDWLRDWDLRSALATEAAPVLALAARDDPIVPEAMSRACFEEAPGVRLEWRETGGHLLARSEPSWCAARIRALSEEVRS